MQLATIRLMAFSLGLELIETPFKVVPEQILGARPAFLWIAWIGPNDDSPMARAHHFATLQPPINIKLLMTAI